MEMPFGKHKGKQVREVPESYLEWCLENINLRPRLKSEIERVLGFEASPPQPAPPVSKIESALKTWKKELSYKWHPDRGGNTQAMQAINDGYQRMAELLLGAGRKGRA